MLRKPVVLVVSWLIFFAAAPPLPSQGDDSAAAPGPAAPPAAASPAGADRARVRDWLDAERFDPEAATEAYMARLSPEARARSDAYFEGGYWLLLWGFLYGLGVAWLLLASGLSARMRDLAERITGIRWLRTASYALEYIVLTAILTFPLTLYQGFFREHGYGLSSQSFLQWMRDAAVGLSVGLVYTRA
jgi:STE24 endopeptidase